LASTETTENGAPQIVAFDDNTLLPALFGRYDQHLARIEQALGVTISSRGNRLAITGARPARDSARQVLETLYRRLKEGQEVGPGDVDGVIRLTTDAAGDDGLIIRTKRRTIAPRSLGQRTYLEALARHDLVFGIGPAGTGKTYLAVAKAVALLMRGEVSRIVLSRPAVEAGERLGFLPGDLKEKVDPYLRPLYDALYDMLPAEQVFRRLESGEIEIAPLAFMRGRTLAHAFVILDEAQNTTPMQMKMLLTRLGEGARMVVTGDLTQIDLPPGGQSGLRNALAVLRGVEGIAFIEFTDADVVRHTLVTRMVRAYERFESDQRGKNP
jgi:phosphate starvation-inducible PhoH-like protein